MPLTAAERKERLPYGANREIAGSLKGVHESYVSRAVAGEVYPKTKPAKQKLRRVQRAVARRFGLTVEETWQPEELAVAGWPLVSGTVT